MAVRRPPAGVRVVSSARSATRQRMRSLRSALDALSPRAPLLTPAAAAPTSGAVGGAVAGRSWPAALGRPPAGVPGRLLRLNPRVLEIVRHFAQAKAGAETQLGPSQGRAPGIETPRQLGAPRVEPDAINLASTAAPRAARAWDRMWQAARTDKGASATRGHLDCYAVPRNIEAVAAFRHEVTRHLEAGSQSPQPEGPRDLAAHDPTCSSMAASCPHRASLSESAPLPSELRWEPRAVIPRARGRGSGPKENGPRRPEPARAKGALGPGQATTSSCSAGSGCRPRAGSCWTCRRTR